MALNNFKSKITVKDALSELSRREKEQGIKPDPDIDVFMKAAAMEGQKSSMLTDYILKWYQSQVVGDKENGVSTSGWRSKKQTIPTDSTTEAEYVAATQHTKEIVWLRKILDDLQEKQTTSTTLFVDNNSAIQLAKNPKFHDQPSISISNIT